jgi:hypothetical protein
VNFVAGVVVETDIRDGCNRQAGWLHSQHDRTLSSKTSLPLTAAFGLSAEFVEQCIAVLTASLP